ncbi:hypothetical protein TDB9533_04750 [Thalassocella blandensis]|nr:hypothetical protein TDB9533_04750 [Thalassocella blandensis]
MTSEKTKWIMPREMALEGISGASETLSSAKQYLKFIKENGGRIMTKSEQTALQSTQAFKDTVKFANSKYKVDMQGLCYANALNKTYVSDSKFAKWIRGTLNASEKGKKVEDSNLRNIDEFIDKHEL